MILFIHKLSVPISYTHARSVCQLGFLTLTQKKKIAFGWYHQIFGFTRTRFTVWQQTKSYMLISEREITIKTTCSLFSADRETDEGGSNVLLIDRDRTCNPRLASLLPVTNNAIAQARKPVRCETTPWEKQQIAYQVHASDSNVDELKDTTTCTGGRSGVGQYCTHLCRKIKQYQFIRFFVAWRFFFVWFEHSHEALGQSAACFPQDDVIFCPFFFHTWKHALKAIDLIRQLHRKASDEREICLLFLWSPRTVENHGFCCDSSSVAIINSAGLPESPTWLPRRRFQRYINFRAKLSEVDYQRQKHISRNNRILEKRSRSSGNQ